VGLDFSRIRIGIGRPVVDGKPTWEPDDVAEYVLSAPGGEDKRLLDEAVKAAADAIEVIMSDGADAAGNRFNRR
jgi:PTH1 family peptidyl-tRNA hydrolase